MTEIKEKQELRLNNVLSFRGKLNPAELEKVGKDMESQLAILGVKKSGNPVSATYGVDGENIDVEILLPINQKIGNIGNYCFKGEIKIVNAVVASYKGNPAGLQNACNELNQYILEKQLQPITVGYNVTKRVDPLNIDNTEIDVYVGISPNIL